MFRQINPWSFIKDACLGQLKKPLKFHDTTMCVTIKRKEFLEVERSTRYFDNFGGVFSRENEIGFDENRLEELQRAPGLPSLEELESS